MSLGSSSGQFIVMRNSPLMSTAPVFAVGLISEKAMNTMKAKPSRTLNSISVNGTKVPSSLPSGKSWSFIAVMLQRGDDMHFGHFGNGVEEIDDRLIEEEVLQLQQKRGPDAGHRYVERGGH